MAQSKSETEITRELNISTRFYMYSISMINNKYIKYILPI